MTPSEVWKLENMRISPFCRMLACSERETLASAIVEFLAKSDSWDTGFEFHTVCKKVRHLNWCDTHDHHGHDGTFQQEFLEDHPIIDASKVNQKFIEYVTRKYDYSQFRPEVVRILIPMEKEAICRWPDGSERQVMVMNDDGETAKIIWNERVNTRLEEVRRVTGFEEQVPSKWLEYKND